MSKLTRGFSRILDRVYLRRWQKVADCAGDEPLAALRSHSVRARALKRRLDRVLHTAEGRLALPLIGSNAIQKPLHTEWAYRPELWRGPVFPSGHAAVAAKTRYGEEATIHHDCAISEITFRQIRNGREQDLAPFGVRLDVFRFDGSFLSLVIELPPEAVDGLTKRHLMRLTADIETEKPLEFFARLNIKHGPNAEQIVREYPFGSGENWVEFDLAYTELNEKRIDRMWVDLIFEGPELNQILLRDVTILRRPRAEL